MHPTVPGALLFSPAFYTSAFAFYSPFDLDFTFAFPIHSPFLHPLFPPLAAVAPA